MLVQDIQRSIDYLKRHPPACPRRLEGTTFTHNGLPKEKLALLPKAFGNRPLIAGACAIGTVGETSMTPNEARKGYLSAPSIGLLTAAAVVTSLRGLPLLAKEEMTMFAYLVFTIIFYLVPASLVSAELGGAFADKKGGIYAWVGEAFGIRWGFLAIWLQWIQNVVWYPVALTFGAAALAYTIGRPELAKNGIFVGAFCIIVYWLATFVVLQGVEVFAKIANWTFILGTIVPGIVLLECLHIGSRRAIRLRGNI